MKLRKLKWVATTLALGVAGYAGFSYFSATAAGDTLVCSGENLIVAAEKSDPELVSKINAKAQTLLNGKGLLWKVEKEGLPISYLFGTMHMSDPRVVKLSERTQAAFDEAKILALEITDVIDEKKMKEKAASLAQFTTYTDGSTLSDRMTDEEEAIASKAFGERAPIPWFLAKRMKPWVVMGAMALPACETARKNAGEPFLDMKLAQMAQKQNMELASLETMEAQMRAMDSLPEDIMMKALHQTAKMGNRMDDVFETMIQLYEQQDMGTVWAMMQHMGEKGLADVAESAGYADFQREIVVKRNHNMVEMLLPLLNRNSTFVAVGALHLPGEDGIVNILAQNGFIVSRQ